MAQSPLFELMVLYPTSINIVSETNPQKASLPVKLVGILNWPSGVGTPTGTITYKDNGVVIGTTSAPFGTLITPILSAGLHSNLTCEYSGDSAFAACSGILTNSDQTAPFGPYGIGPSLTQVVYDKVFLLTDPDGGKWWMSYDDGFGTGADFSSLPDQPVTGTVAFVPDIGRCVITLGGNSGYAFVFLKNFGDPTIIAGFGYQSAQSPDPLTLFAMLQAF